MKIKHKRLIIIGCCIAWGILAMGIFCVSGTTSISKFNLPDFIFVISSWSCIITLLTFSKHVIIFNAIATIFISQFIVYAVLGIIISCIIYSPLRLEENELSTHPESDK
jgi:hypothetical protein